MTYFIRPARKEDAVLAAVLLAETNGDFGIQVIGLGNPDLQVKALQTWFAEEGNRFSYQLSLIAENYGMAVGLMLGFSGADLNRLNLGVGRKIFTIYGMGGALKMIWRNGSLARVREAAEDEFLIAHLAVEQQFRRQGIGKKLLEIAEEQALASGLHKLALEVDIENKNAIALYQKSGYAISQQVHYHDPSSRMKSVGFYKMTKSIQGAL